MENEAAIFETHRQWLLNIAYRMVGSVDEAEDLVQETWLRWQAHAAGVVQPRAWLTQTLTRLTLDFLGSASRRRELYVGPWLPEPVRTDSENLTGNALELADALSMAMLVLLERLSPPERAAFLLREVFDYSYAEVADVLAASEPNCRQLVSRAKGQLKKTRTRFDVSKTQRRTLIQSFAQAAQAGDMNALLGVLAMDCTAYNDGGGKAVSALRPVYGADRVARFMLGITRKAPVGTLVEMAMINGEPGLLTKVKGKVVTAFTFALDEQGLIYEIYTTRNPDKLKNIS